MVSMEQYDDLVVKNNHKVLSPLEVKEGMTIYNLFKEYPFKYTTAGWCWRLMMQVLVFHREPFVYYYMGGE